MSKFYDLKVNLEQFKKIAKGEKVMFSHKPIQLDKNLFGYYFIALAQGLQVELPKYNYNIKLEEGIKRDDILLAMLGSKVVRERQYHIGYTLTYPNIFEHKDFRKV